MQLPRCSLLVTLAAISLLPGVRETSATSFCGLQPGIVKSSQPLAGDEFIGTSVSARPLRPKFKFEPESSTLHGDNGNTGSVDYHGPLGRDLNITSLDRQFGLFYWDANETMYGVYIGPCNGSDTSIVQAIAVLNPETLDIETAWQLPPEYASSQLNTAYLQVLMETGKIVLSAAEGQIYILEKCEDATGSPSIEVQRLIDLKPSGVLKEYPLLNTMMDAAGNVWFTTGEIDAERSGEPTKESVIGYVERDGTVHSLTIPNQSVGQGLSVSNTTVFVNTQPSAKDDHPNAVGFLMALQPGPASSVHVAWNATYQAGSRKKSKANARGSGTTPSLLGPDFVTIADNTDVQINLLIYAQHASGNDVEPVCAVPLWHPNASWTDNGPLVHYDGKDYGVVVGNLFNQPQLYTGNQTDGPHNNLTTMAPGISKVFVAGNGSGCHVEWTNPGRTTTLLTLSTKTGLMYGYEQSEELAIEGQYVWYATAIDYKSGETVWKARTGAGGTFNNNYRTTFLNPDGTLYQMVQGGVVIVKDGER